MVQAVHQQLMRFQEFLAWKPGTGRYELHDGVIVEMQPTGPHEQVVGLLNRKLNVLIDQEEFNFFIPNTAMLQPLGSDTGYKPDISDHEMDGRGRPMDLPARVSGAP